MSHYAYRAYDQGGRIVSGGIEAANEKAALEAIRQRGLFPFETKAGAASEKRFSWLYTEIGGNALGLKDRAQFARITSALLQAGVPLDKALTLIATGEETPRIARAANAMREKLVAGARFSDAVAAAPGFRAEEIGLIRAGEQTGQTSTTTAELANLLDARIALRDKILGQLTYPFILLLVAFASLAVIATVLVPNVTPVFEQAGKPLPVLLRWLGNIQAVILARPSEAALALALLVLLLILFFRSAGSSKMFDSALHLLKTGRKAVAGRFCRILGTLLRNGSDLQTALRLACDASGSARLKREGQAVLDEVTTGRTLSQSLSRLSSMDAQALQLIAIGEDTNRLDDMLLHVAKTHEASVARAMERIVTLMTPVLTILIGLMVGGLIMSVMRAILSLNELAR